jgi:hypothetical protein
MRAPEWDQCEHVWERNISGMSGRECHCVKCGCPGDMPDDYEENGGEVYWPAT